MTTAIKRRRGTTSEHSTFTGLEGEITIDTTKDTVVVHDGSTAGGFPLAKENNPTFTGTATFTGLVTADSINFNGLSPTVAYDFNGDGSVTSADGLDYLQMGSGAATGVNISSVDTITPSWSALSGSIYSDNKFRIMSARGNSTDALRIVSSLTAEGHGDTTIIGNVEVDGVNTRIITGLGVSGDNINLLSDGSKRLSIASNGDISFYEDTGTTPKLFWDASAESLGLGTTSPIKPLTIAVGNTSTISGVALNHGASNYWGFGSYTDQSFRIAKSHGLEDANTYFAINRSNGNVGIGTSSPDTPLTVNGSSKVYSTTINNSITHSVTTTSAYAQTITLDDFGLSFDSNSNLRGYRFGNNGNERLRITSAGRVGIGTSSPDATSLHVHTASAGTLTPNSAADDLVVENNGNAGITIASPDANYSGIIFSSPSDATGSIIEYNQSGATLDIGTAISGGVLRLRSGNFSEAMRIDSSGHLRIGDSANRASLRLENTAQSGFSIGAGFYTGSTQSTIEFQDSNTTANYKVRIGCQTDDLLMFAGGTERLRITNVGRVGIGTNSPSTDLHIYGSSPELRVQSTATNNGFIRFINTSGSMSVGMSGSAANQFLLYDRTNSHTAYLYAGGASGSHIWSTNNSERMRIDSSGNLLVGTTTDGGVNGLTLKKYSTGVSQISNVSFGGGFAQHTYRYNGTTVGSILTYTNATAYNTTSDYRLKEDVQPMTGAIERVNALNPVNFAWKSDGSRVDGFLAHEAQAVVPEAVHGTKDAVDADGNPDYQGIDQSKLVPLLTAALQEAITKIEDLEARVATLEGN